MLFARIALLAAVTAALQSCHTPGAAGGRPAPLRPVSRCDVLYWVRFEADHLHAAWLRECVFPLPNQRPRPLF